jgi:small neutral amino acid transporter SnatA (MarC family)
MSFDAIFFLLFGLFTLIMGILNKGNAFWGSFEYYDGLKKSLGKNYSRIINVIMGIISILIGITLYRKG